MEQQKLPRANAVLILGILSIVTCCCFAIPGIVFSSIALLIGKQDMALYKEAPEQYSNYSNLNTGRILALIGLSLSVLFLVFLIYRLVTLGWDGVQEVSDEFWRAYEEGQRQGAGN